MAAAEKAAGPAKAVAAAANTSVDAANWAAEQLASWALDSGRTVLGSGLLASLDTGSRSLEAAFAAFAGGSAFAALNAFAGYANKYLYVPDLRFPNCTEASTFRLVVAGGRWRSCRAACNGAHSC